ncbi:MAG TPA: alpha/beta fold hydrolase [Candidatus Anoxymicrobiaceae bacterium]
MNTVESLRMEAAWLRNLARFRIWAHRTRIPSTRGRVFTGDISIYYQACGSGEPVLFLHGGFSSGDSWAPQVMALAPKYRSIFMDSRGHGRTTLGRLGLSYEQMGRDAVALIEDLNAGPAHVVGWSDGGTTALAMALSRPDLLRSMTLLGTPFSIENYSRAAWLSIHSFLSPLSRELLFVRAMRRLTSPEPWDGAAFVRQMRRMWTQEPNYTTEDLSRIHIPTLVIACDSDEFLSTTEEPLGVFEATARALPSARMSVILGGNHSVSIERPDDVNHLILEFLDDLNH